MIVSMVMASRTVSVVVDAIWHASIMVSPTVC